MKIAFSLLERCFHNKVKGIVSLFFFLFINTYLFSQDFFEDPDVLFQDAGQNQIIDSEEILSKSEGSDDLLNKKGVTFGGEVFFKNFLSILKEEKDDDYIDNTTFLGGRPFLRYSDWKRNEILYQFITYLFFISN